jgi:hypothetical protein
MPFPPLGCFSGRQTALCLLKKYGVVGFFARLARSFASAMRRWRIAVDAGPSVMF